MGMDKSMDQFLESTKCQSSEHSFKIQPAQFIYTQNVLPEKILSPDNPIPK
jgi:hypothetical protein